MFTISFFLLLSQLSWPHCYCTLFSEYTLPPWEALGPPLLLLTRYAQGFSLGPLLYTMYMLSLGQIKSLSKLAFFFHLMNISQLCPSLTDSAAETLIHAFVSTWMDHCNGVVFWISTKAQDRTQPPGF